MTRLMMCAVAPPLSWIFARLPLLRHLAGLHAMNGDLGRARSLLAFNICVLIVYGTAITLASRHGLLVVSITSASVYLVLLFAVYRFLLARYIGISISNLAPELGPALCGCAALIAVASVRRASFVAASCSSSLGRCST